VEGKMEMTFVTGSLTGFAKFYLLFGEHADIIEPLSLKDVILKNLEAIKEKLAT